ncbi:MAG: molybdopterin-synthase adenylyltransferase MoeB [Nitrincola sp.]|nr:molybdopterin-synthase adenylyltransferase MoeB [Nitrincola sp.]
MLDDQQLLRYSRHIMLPDIDIEGQQRLLHSRVLILGLGGLGSPASLYLASAGVGELWLVDDDRVDLSNLQRQIAHTQGRVGQSKVASAAAAIEQINSEVRLRLIDQRVTGNELRDLVKAVDLVLDCSDNFSTRFALNKACFESGVPLVSGAAIRFDGQVSVFDPRQKDSPCYQCLYPEGDDAALTCAESGVLAPLVGVIGSIQAMEAIKLLTGAGKSLAGRLLLLDGRRMEWREMRLSKDPECLVCAPR